MRAPTDRYTSPVRYVAFALAMLPAVAAGEDLAAFLTHYEARRPQLLAEFKAGVEAAQKDLDKHKQGTVSRGTCHRATLPNGRVVYASVTDKNAAVKARESDLKAAQDRLAAAERGELVIPKLKATPRVGDFGTAELGSFEVVQVIDGQNMIGHGVIGDHIQRQEAGPYGEQTRLVLPANQTYWLTGFPTAGLADGVNTSIDGRAVWVVGNKTYTTALGTTNTVLQIQAIDVEAAKLARERKR